MKLAAGHSRAPYRNDAIFRSAERLISSATHLPARDRIPHIVFFVSGIACGLLLAFLLLCSDRLESAPGARTSRLVSSPVIDPPRQSAAPLTTRSATLVTPAPTNTPRLAANSPAAPLTATPLPSPLERSPSAAAATSVGATRAADLSLSAPILAITSATTRIVLRGELRSTLPAVAPIAVKFELQFVPARTGLSGSLSGLVTFEEYGPPAPTLRIYGSFTPHAIMLRELQKIPVGASHAGDGYTFLIDRSDATDPGELAGTWTHGANHGPLLVKSALAL